MQVEQRVLVLKKQGDGVRVVPFPELAVERPQAVLKFLGALGGDGAGAFRKPPRHLPVPGETPEDGERPLYVLREPDEASASRCAEAIAAGLQPCPSSSSSVRWYRQLLEERRVDAARGEGQVRASPLATSSPERSIRCPRERQLVGQPVEIGEDCTTPPGRTRA